MPNVLLSTNVLRKKEKEKEILSQCASLHKIITQERFVACFALGILRQNEIIRLDGNSSIFCLIILTWETKAKKKWHLHIHTSLTNSIFIICLTKTNLLRIYSESPYIWFSSTEEKWTQFEAKLPKAQIKKYNLTNSHVLLWVLKLTVWNWLSQKWEQCVYTRVVFFPGSCRFHFTKQFLLLGQIEALDCSHFLYLLSHEIVSHIQIPSISQLKWYMPERS